MATPKKKATSPKRQVPIPITKRLPAPGAPRPATWRGGRTLPKTITGGPVRRKPGQGIVRRRKSS